MKIFKKLINYVDQAYQKEQMIIL